MPQTFDITRLRVASPCHIPWADMTGDERVRHCGSCDLNVYNTAEMTAAEVEDMVRTREGRLCIRMYRRADGTVLTQDCPVGLRSYTRRVTRLATAAAAAVFALVSTTFSQTRDIKATDAKVRITRLAGNFQTNWLHGTVVDPAGAVIPNARLELTGSKGSMVQSSNEEGRFVFKDVEAGLYTISVTANGFKKGVVTNFSMPATPAGIQISLELTISGEVVGIFVLDDAPIDVTSSTVETKIDIRKMERIPH